MGIYVMERNETIEALLTAFVEDKLKENEPCFFSVPLCCRPESFRYELTCVPCQYYIPKSYDFEAYK